MTAANLCREAVYIKKFTDKGNKCVLKHFKRIIDEVETN